VRFGVDFVGETTGLELWPDLPDGQITPASCSPLSIPLAKNFSHCPDGQIISTSPARSRPQEGRIAIVTDVGRGMRWTRFGAVDERADLGRRSRVVLMPRRWHQVGNDCFCNRAGDGDNKARSPGRARRKPLKPIVRGMPDRFRPACGDYARMLFSFAYEAVGAADAPGIPCALCFEGREFISLGRLSRRERADVCPIPSSPGIALRRTAQTYPADVEPTLSLASC